MSVSVYQINILALKRIWAGATRLATAHDLRIHISRDLTQLGYSAEDNYFVRNYEIYVSAGVFILYLIIEVWRWSVFLVQKSWIRVHKRRCGATEYSVVQSFYRIKNSVSNYSHYYSQSGSEPSRGRIRTLVTYLKYPNQFCNHFIVIPLLILLLHFSQYRVFRGLLRHVHELNISASYWSLLK